jgi:hypothetical protein
MRFFTSFRERCVHVCRILREGHTPRVILELIGPVVGVKSGIDHNHWREYKARHNEIKHVGRPPALSWQELNEIIADILHGFQQWCPLTLSEIASVIQSKYQKFLLPDTLYYVLTQEPRVKSCRGQPIDEHRMRRFGIALQHYFPLAPGRLPISYRVFHSDMSISVSAE